MNQLSACPSCQRHVRVSEAACPFCQALLDDAFRSKPAPRRPLARLGRAALFTFATGTAAAAGVAACSDDSTGTTHGSSGNTPLYGGPPVDPTASPVYGAPAIDAGHDSGDASHD